MARTDLNLHLAVLDLMFLFLLQVSLDERKKLLAEPLLFTLAKPCRNVMVIFDL